MRYSLNDIANIVAKKIVKQFDVAPQDLDDLYQSAAEGVIRARQTTNRRHQGYEFKAAFNGALKGLYEVWGRHSPAHGRKVPLEEFENLVFGETEGEVKEFCSEEQLFELFFLSRTKRGERGRKAACRDAFIVKRLLEGASVSIIAEELGLSRRVVSRYRAQIQERLRKI